MEIKNNNHEKQSSGVVKELIDIEEYSEKGKNPPKGQRYQIRVNNTKYIVDIELITGREILELAGKVPADGYYLYSVIKGNRRLINLNEQVDLTSPGIERFVSKPKEATEGSMPVEILPASSVIKARRQHIMPEEDEDFLNKSGLPWETILESSQKWLLVYNYPLPGGYNIDKADFALRIDACYPSTQIDMIYFSPHLSRRDGKMINNLTTLPIDAKTWQQWSRHRTSENPWEPGVDNVSTHIDLMLYCLKQEFSKR